MLRRMRFCPKTNLWHFRRPWPSVAYCGRWPRMNVAANSTTNSFDESSVLPSIVGNIFKVVCAWLIGVLLGGLLCFLFSCHHPRQVENESVSLSSLAASQVEHSRRVLLASNIPLSLPINITPDDSPSMVRPSTTSTDVPWVLAIEETSCAADTAFAQKQHLEEQKNVGISSYNVKGCFIAAIIFLCSLVAALWYRLRRP